MRLYYTLIASLNLAIVFTAFNADNKWWWVAATFTAVVLFIDCLTKEPGMLHPLILVGGIFNFMAVFPAIYADSAAAGSMALYGSLLLFVGHIGELVEQHILKR